jgi:oligopeptidase A
MNPLLDYSGLPRFADIQPHHVAPAMDQLLTENQTLVQQLLADSAPPTWQNFVLPMEDANERVSRAWGPVGHLNAVMNSPELREVYNATLPKITAYYAELGQNLALFEKFKILRHSPEFAGLSRARQKIIDNELRDFRLGGAELSEDKKAHYLEIQEKLSELCSRFSDNLLDATNDFSCLVEDKNQLTGLPADVLQVAAEAATAADKTGWLFSLKAPSYMPVMQFADDRTLRENLYRAYSTRAAEFGKAEHDNTPLMDEIVALRGEEARLLGFANFGELSLAAKMADTPAQVVQFMRELALRQKHWA